MSMGMRLKNTATTEIQTTVNGVAVPQLNVIKTGNVLPYSDVNDLRALNYTGNAGDVINFQTAQNGGGNDVVVSLIIMYLIPPL